jgi:dienelactone hydrolase
MKSWIVGLVGLVVLVVALSSQAAIKTEVIEYKDGNTVLEGYLAWDDAVTTPRPAVIIAHDWMGLGDFAKGKAEALAKLGYVVFAADCYGKGIRPKNSDEARAEAGKYYGDRSIIRGRLNAAITVVTSRKEVDPSRIGGIGFCFGGMAVLELARSGAEVKGVVSFHGGLNTPNHDDAKNIKGKILVLHGADDPFVGADEVMGFEHEMTSAGCNWELVKYSGAVHSFTNPAAGSDNAKGAAYNAQADARSWIAMKNFFEEVLK